MRRSLLMLVPLLAVPFTQPAAAQIEIGPESTRIPEGGARVELNMDLPIPVIHASINGQGPFPFLLDTGAGGIVLDETFAQEMGMEVVGTQRVRDMGAGVDIDGETVRIDQVEVGGATFSGLDALLINGTGILGASGAAPRGVIGRSPFADCLLTMDYPSRVVLIEEGELPRADGQTILPYTCEEGASTPDLKIDVAGVQHTVHIDSGGSSGITLPFDRMDSFPLESEPKVIGRARSAGGSFEVYGSKLEGTIALGAHSWDSPQVTFVPNIQWVHLGSNVLERFVITWDQRNRRVRFVDPSGIAIDRSQAKRPKRYGLQFDPRRIGKGPLVVEGVTEGMAAETFGVQAGDRIIAIDDRPVSGMSQLDLATAFRRSPLTLKVDRGGETIRVTMSLD
jgi:hypothetical protein